MMRFLIVVALIVLAPVASSAQAPAPKEATAEEQNGCVQQKLCIFEFSSIAYADALNVIANCWQMGWTARVALPSTRFAGRIMAESFEQSLALLLPSEYQFSLVGKPAVIDKPVAVAGATTSGPESTPATSSNVVLVDGSM